VMMEAIAKVTRLLEILFILAALPGATVSGLKQRTG